MHQIRSIRTAGLAKKLVLSSHCTRRAMTGRQQGAGIQARGRDSLLAAFMPIRRCLHTPHAIAAKNDSSLFNGSEAVEMRARHPFPEQTLCLYQQCSLLHAIHPSSHPAMQPCTSGNSHLHSSPGPARACSPQRRSALHGVTCTSQAHLPATTWPMP